MIVLAIDTSSRGRTVCVRASGDGSLIDAEVVRDQAVGVALPRALTRMLGGGLGAVVVTSGPGSYTGVRAGMAAALGIAQARSLPLHGVGALDVVAAGAPASFRGDLWAVADAGRGALYVALVRTVEGRRIAGDALRVTAGDWDRRGLPAVSTDGASGGADAVVPPEEALAAAVPQALASTPLDAATLRAIHAG